MTVPPRINIVTLGVGDLPGAVAFYGRLGWELCASSQDAIAWYRTGGAYVGLFPREELAKDANVPADEPAAFDGVTLAINVATEDEVGAALDAAVAAGARLLKPATRADWGGLSGYFADPDGHAWEVAYNPFFPIDEQGVITIP
jgi:catechol 2,3-dioxygenase-like lactoylglutathione lyase family enzyme